VANISNCLYKFNVNLKVSVDSNKGLHLAKSVCAYCSPLHNVCNCQIHQILENMISVYNIEIFTAVTMKICVFWDVTPCGSCENRRFGGASLCTLAIYNPTLLPRRLSASSILNSILASFLTWYFFAACVGY
jgi:hypothetical protein